MAYTVQLHPSQHVFSAEANESLLDAALRHGLVVPYGCRTGACGSCKSRLMQGEVRYLDDTLESLGKLDRAVGEILLCQATAASDLVVDAREIEHPLDIQVKRLPCRVAKMETLAPDVIRLYLKLPETERLAFLPGQYLDILLRDGRRRSFSMANAPRDDAMLELHIRRVPGGEFTGQVFEKMREKDLLRLEGPLGTFFLREETDRPVILLAGGTGFAPIKAIVEYAIEKGMQRPLFLYWGARAKQDLYLHDLAQSWAGRLRYVPVLSEPQASDGWTGRTGFVHQAVLEDFTDLRGHEAYVCGPPVMVEAARQAFIARGLDQADFYSDTFSFAKDQRP